MEIKEPLGGAGRFGGRQRKPKPPGEGSKLLVGPFGGEKKEKEKEPEKRKLTESEKATVMLDWAGKIRSFIQRELGIESVPEDGELENAISFWKNIAREDKLNDQLIVCAKKYTSDQWRNRPIRYWGLAVVLTERSQKITGGTPFDY